MRLRFGQNFELGSRESGVGNQDKGDKEEFLPRFHNKHLLYLLHLPTPYSLLPSSSARLTG